MLMTENKYDKWILVTGASTGIGRKTTEYLAKNGFSVYACARKDDDLKALGEIDHVTPVRLDVTKDDEIEAAVSFVERQGTGLYALVNNAGITKGGPLVVLPEGYLETLFETNFFGMHKVTRAFFPLISKSRGRIMIMGSVMGFIGYPLVGPYCCSKYAIEAYADCLRRELFLSGTKVSLIQPGYVKSELWEKSTHEFEETKQLLSESIWKPYKEVHSRFFQMFLDDAERYGIDSEKVARCVFKASTSRFPKSRYLVSEFNPRYWLIKNLFGFQLDIYFKALYAWARFKNRLNREHEKPVVRSFDKS